MYFLGQGVKQDYFKAIEWFKKASSQKYTPAQKQLGYMYRYGIGVKKDYSKAKKYYGLACDNRDQDGCDAYSELNQ